ncbi:MAG: SMI1/KNR4 family protein [Parachlamydiaceae bacterium]|nr:SMI1/KNR4 family protein [Parachlamydiaceae bacterium]
MPTDPGHWKENDLPLKELLQWEKEGYPEGKGYVEPEVNPSLSNPTSPLEVACANLEKFLAKARSDSFDPANPTNILFKGDRNEIDKIIEKWKLPSIYLDFLTRFSPLNVDIYSSNFVIFLHLYGTSDLLKERRRFLEPIPSEYIIIGADGHDVYVMDLTKSDGFDAPILYRGEGEDNFVKYTDSFVKFLGKLCKK